MRNTLYYGDNLDVLRKLPNESIDLIYLDPPFNSKRNYNVIFREKSGVASPAQLEAFTDTWSWGQTAEEAIYELTTQAPAKVSRFILAMQDVLGDDPLMAYLTVMAQRLVELHRVLKTTGSLYLHCDPTASHYLKVLLDSVFGAKHFRSEIIWKRTSAHSGARRYGPVHDIVLFYSKSNRYAWNNLYQPYEQSYLDEFYTHRDDDGRRWRRSDLTGSGTRQGATGQPWRGIDVTRKGRHWAVPPTALDELDSAGKIHWPAKRGGMPMFKRYADEQPGVPLQDVWVDIPPMHNLSTERLNYPTQKPLALLERIIQASSNPGDIVLDPFCGCGTAVAAAERLGRNWIGIDITYLAIAVMMQRFRDHFAGPVDYVVEGIPTDVTSARALFEQSPYQFQYWAVDKLGINARPRENKGRDRGIDGEFFYSDDRGRPVRGIIQVKGGQTGSRDIRDFRGTMERERVELGIFVCMQKPTRDMLSDAAHAGVIASGFTGRRHPRIQILTVAELFDDRRVDIPHMQSAHQKAPKLRRPQDESRTVPIELLHPDTASGESPT